MKDKEFLGLECVEFSINDLNILVTRSVGPRILSLRFQDDVNLFAELPGLFLDFVDGRKFYFYGGHRFWCAPEIPETTYSPDDLPIVVVEKDGTVSLIQEIDPIAGIQKEIQIRSTNLENTLVIDHFLYNKSVAPKTFAPWAITQLNLDGVAILPFNEKMGMPDPYQPDRTLILWPYTDMRDQRISTRNGLILIDPKLGEGPLKIGIPNSQNWLAYQFNDTIFLKFSKNFSTPWKFDLGAAGQCYCNDQFIELETLGDLRQLKPGDSLYHREVWKVAKVNFSVDEEGKIWDFLYSNSWMDKCRDLLEA